MKSVILIILLLASFNGYTHNIVLPEGMEVVIERKQEHLICINHHDKTKDIPEMCLNQSLEDYSKFSEYFETLKVGEKKLIKIREEISISMAYGSSGSTDEVELDEYNN